MITKWLVLIAERDVDTHTVSKPYSANGLREIADLWDYWTQHGAEVRVYLSRAAEGEGVPVAVDATPRENRTGTQLMGTGVLPITTIPHGVVPGAEAATAWFGPAAEGVSDVG